MMNFGQFGANEVKMQADKKFKRANLIYFLTGCNFYCYSII